MFPKISMKLIPLVFYIAPPFEVKFSLILCDFRRFLIHKFNSPYLLLNPCSNDGKMHLRAIDDYMREVIHKDVLGYGDEREARSAHDCRRTYASLEYLNGTDLNVIKEQLGHSSVGQTWDYIKNVVEPSKRRQQLKGGNLLVEDITSQEPANNVVDAVWTHKKAK